MNDDQNKIEWEKPAWTKGVGLRKTGKSATDNLAKPITDLPHMKDGAAPGFQKPQWTGDVKEDKGIHGDLAKPITSAPHGSADPSLSFKKPEWTKEVKEDKGIHGDLAKPITSAPHGGADPNLSFAKPEWTKDAGLQTTGKGQKLKEGKEIARPIGGIKAVDE
jgi:hypothetical protein